MIDERFEQLTPAEREVMRAALGRTNDQVAHLLGISSGTVAAHVLSARRKLGSMPRGDVARGFQAWEASQQNLPRRFPPMVGGGATENERPAASEPVRDARTEFVFLDQPVPAPISEPQHDRNRSYERIVLVLLAVCLIMACFHYLPDWAERAQDIGNILKPYHR